MTNPRTRDPIHRPTKPDLGALVSGKAARGPSTPRSQRLRERTTRWGKGKSCPAQALGPCEPQEASRSVREPRAPSSSVSSQQTQEGAIRSRKQVPESRLCHASAQLAATHRRPEEPSRSGRHLQCTREAKQTEEPASSWSTLGAVSYVGRGF